MVTPRRHRLASICALLAGALLLAAWPAAAQAAFFSYSGAFVPPSGRFVEASGVATDDAGRVYVADAGAGRVHVFESAPAGNVYISSLGVGQLARPSGIAIDNRNRIYVADAGRNRIVQYDSFVDGAPTRREFSGAGTQLGAVDGPRMMTTDRASRLYVVDRPNARVQFLRPALDGRPVAAFGVAEPAVFLDPEGIARDSEGRMFVSDDNPSNGEVRVYDPRGALLKIVAGPGDGGGQVSSPRGLVRDPINRLLVVDAGNSRVQALRAFADGSTFIEAFGTRGSGAGGFSSPAGAAVAPGALLYVADTGNGRVVRLRYDDADADGALDVRDNCAGVANPVQRDSDRDKRGDDCDPDDDNDTIPDGADKCPRSRRGADANSDGCGDPRSRILFPRARGTYAARQAPARVGGFAGADDLGVASVQVAIARVARGRCAWYTGRRFGSRAKCSAPVFFAASGQRRWAARVGVRSRGAYRVVSRATQTGGLVEAVFNRRNVRSFWVR